MTSSRIRSILIVEDEEKIARFMSSRLELAGYAVSSETRGRTALESAAQRPPDLVILDLRLPDIAGFEVCRELRRTHPSWGLAVLIVSALDQPIDKLRGFAYGADAYLTKPFDMTELLDTVTQLLNQRPSTSADSSHNTAAN